VSSHETPAGSPPTLNMILRDSLESWPSTQADQTGHILIVRERLHHLGIDFVSAEAMQGICAEGCDCDGCKKRFLSGDDLPDLTENDSDDEQDGGPSLLDGGPAMPAKPLLQISWTRHVDDEMTFTVYDEQDGGPSLLDGGPAMPAKPLFQTSWTRQHVDDEMTVTVYDESDQHESNCACPAVEVCGVGDDREPDKKSIVDTGCTASCSGSKVNLLKNFVPRSESISLGNSAFRVQSYGRGTLGPLADVMWAPDMS
jgi:hypothetical protein